MFSLDIYKTNKEQTPHLTHYQQLHISDFYTSNVTYGWIIGDLKLVILDMNCGHQHKR